MTSYDKFSSWENCSRYPYVDRVSVVGAKEGDKVDFIYQFVKKRFVPVDHENFSIFHTAPEIIGPPKFQHYGKLVDLSISFNDFHMIQDGTGVSISPWRKKDILRPEDKQLRHSDFYAPNDKRCIDIEFDEAVYPIRVCIYEICTPGSVRQILAQDSNGSWHELWSVSHFQYFLHNIPPQSRLFAPPLSPLSCTIKTKMLRIVFKGSWQISYTKLDAVMLIGTSKLIHSRNPNESLIDMIKKINSMYYPHCNNVYYNFTEDLNSIHLDIAYLQQNFQHYCNISNSDIASVSHSNNNVRRIKVPKKVIPGYTQPLGYRYSRRILMKAHSTNANKRLNTKPLSSSSSSCHLSALPNEVLLMIFKHLDLATLCNTSRVDRRFNYLTRDRKLYKSLNMRWINRSEKYIHDILHNFTYRCKHLRQLDVTGCAYTGKNMASFIKKCGSRLTHLRLSDERYYGQVIRTNSNIDLKVVLRAIPNTCTNLKELDLSYCYVEDEGFSYLEELNTLEHLNLFNTIISYERLCKILRNNQRMRELSVERINDAVLIELGTSCRNLEVLSSSFGPRHITSRGINALANCTKLERIKFNLFTYYFTNIDDNLFNMLSRGENLKELYLSWFSLTLQQLNVLAQCKKLEKLYLVGVQLRTTPDYFSVIFKQCSTLRELYFLYCNNIISNELLNEWKKLWPHVSVYTMR